MSNTAGTIHDALKQACEAAKAAKAEFGVSLTTEDISKLAISVFINVSQPLKVEWAKKKELFHLAEKLYGKRDPKEISDRIKQLVGGGLASLYDMTVPQFEKAKALLQKEVSRASVAATTTDVPVSGGTETAVSPENTTAIPASQANPAEAPGASHHSVSAEPAEQNPLNESDTISIVTKLEDDPGGNPNDKRPVVCVEATPGLYAEILAECSNTELFEIVENKMLNPRAYRLIIRGEMQNISDMLDMARTLTKERVNWRVPDATAKQITLLKKIGCSPEGLNSAGASQILSKYYGDAACQ